MLYNGLCGELHETDFREGELRRIVCVSVCVCVCEREFVLGSVCVYVNIFVCIMCVCVCIMCVCVWSVCVTVCVCGVCASQCVWICVCVLQSVSGTLEFNLIEFNAKQNEMQEEKLGTVKIMNWHLIYYIFPLFFNSGCYCEKNFSRQKIFILIILIIIIIFYYIDVIDCPDLFYF